MHLKSVSSMKTLNSCQHPPPRRNCNKKIVWYIGRIFLRLIDKHFPRHHKYWKLFNRNNVKISYSYIPNIASAEPVPTDIKECSCRRKPECQLDKKCSSECLVYNASVDRQDTKLNTKLNTIMELARRTLKSVITTTQHLLEIKAKKKGLNSQNTSGS